MKLIVAITLLIIPPSVAFSDPPVSGPPSRPSESPRPLNPPSVDPPPTKSAPADEAVERIREALQSGQVTPAGGLLGDVLEVIRKRGSILDGSVLDPLMEPEPNAVDPVPAANRFSAGDQKPTQNVSQTVRTAELLLRSARRLERVSSDDDQCLRLIRQMRVRATSMLSDLYLTP